MAIATDDYVVMQYDAERGRGFLAGPLDQGNS